MKGLQPFQAIFAQSRERIAAWNLSSAGQIGLAEVVANAHPTVLIGTSGQAHAFIEPVLRTMAAGTRHRSSFRSPTRRSGARPHRKIFSPGRRIARLSAPGARSQRLFARAARSGSTRLTTLTFIPVSVWARSPSRRVAYRKQCFLPQQGRLPPCLLPSAIRTPICCRRSASPERSRFRWRLLWRSRQEAKGLHVLSRRTTSPQMSNR